MKKVTVEVDDEVYAVANVLRQSYYENEMKDLVGSRHPLMWVRMAEAAIAVTGGPKKVTLDDVDRMSGN